MNLKKNDILMSLRANEMSEAIRRSRCEAVGRSNLIRLLRHSLSSFLAMTTVGSLCVLAGCGYATKAVLPDYVKTVHVDTFKNNIDITKEISAKDKYEVYRPNLEVDLRDAIVSRVFLDGNLKIANKDSADAVLEGQIVQYRKDPLRYQNEIVQEYRISIVCSIKLINQDNSKVLFEEENITGDTTYFTTGTLQKTETAALNDAMSDLARRIVNRIVENW